jgi:thiol:disulfide interchange protein DsbD
MPKPERTATDRVRRDRVLPRTLLAVAWVLLVGIGAAAGAATFSDVRLLPAEEAFRFGARALDARTIEVRFSVADGYYLYRDKLRFTAEPGAASAPELPPGKLKDDAFFGRVETYRREVVGRFTIAGGAPGDKVVVKAESQGCADAGVCYPPNVQQVTLALPPGGAPGPLIEAHPAKKRWFP